jgi:predicted RNase H-like HicB family nuclease
MLEMEAVMKFAVILEPEKIGYSIHCPALPGCVSQGDSREEALTNIREAIEGILALREKYHIPSPEETPELVAEEIRRCLKDRSAEGLPLTIEIEEVEVSPKVAV